MSSKPKQRSKKNIDATDPSKTSCASMGDTELGQKINGFINGGTYAIITTIIMVYTLFSDDIRQVFFSADADITFSYITLVCMIYYAFQIIVFSIFQKDYFLKYYFWLDILSTITMCFDLIWITQYLSGGGKNAANISQISRASRAARLGTRTVRLIRLVRMIKVLRQMKIFSKNLNKVEVQQPPKKMSQRLSSIHSKLASLRNIQKLNSLRHMQKIPSKRWSLIKQTNGMNIIGEPQRDDLISIQCFPFKEKDAIVDRAQSESKPSSKSIKIVKSAKKIEEEAKNKVVILQNIQEQEKSEKRVDQVDDSSKFKSKKSRFDRTNKDLKDHPSDNQIIDIPPQSKVGSRVQAEIQKNVILMIIIILVSIPLLDGTTWFTPLSVYDKSFDEPMYFANNFPANYQKQMNFYIADSASFLNPLVFFSISTASINDIYPDNYNSTVTADQLVSSTRTEDLDTYTGQGYTVAFDISWYNKEIALMSIGRTIFVCMLLIITTMLFSNDLQFAAIAPLQDMFDTVKKIAIHPLNALREIQERNLCMENIQQQDNGPNTEPKVLQNTIVKIGSLLAVGFGQAGTQIICRVIQDPSIINVMIPGQKIMAVFGFCDIRNFTDATEVLEADVMVFVNQIAAICHRVTYEHLGSPNKNIGDAFLLVWKFAQSDCKVTEGANEMTLELLKTPKVSQTADLAVLALVKMIAEITKAKSLQKYKNNKGLQQRIPNYAGVKMGFGLHVGWAIEGPIGSQYKIDASYLGSHVHMASRLEGATKAYGASMLITGGLYNIMSKNKSNLRHIDRVIPTGQTEITDLYTIDIVPKHLFEAYGVKEQKNLNQKEKRKAKVCQNMNRKKLTQGILTENATDSLWNDEDIRIMQEPYINKFYEEWQKGFSHYLQGNWQSALSELNCAKSYAPEGSDGPTESLIKFIQEHKCKVPEDWQGYREFD